MLADGFCLERARKAVQSPPKFVTAPKRTPQIGYSKSETGWQIQHK